MHKYSELFKPQEIKNIRLKNRIVMAPMATNFSLTNGEVSDTLVAYYEERARGGAGLIIVEASCVEWPRGREGFSQIRIDHPACLPGLNRLSESIKRYGCCAFIQLLHTGRQTSSAVAGDNSTVAPSSIACPMMKEIPHALSIEEIKTLVKKFAQAADYAYRAGFEGVEIHAAHGYLINQFLSLHSNQRDDMYGGSLENRQRFLLEIIREIKSNNPELLISVRLNIDDFVEGGFAMGESLPLCETLEKAGIDLLNISCGTYESGLTSIEPSSYPEGWRVYLAEAVKKRVSIPVITGGMIRNPAFANQVIAQGKADLVFLGRPLLADPYWPEKARKGEDDEIRPCINCNTCIYRNFQGLSIACTVNPQLGREKIYKYEASTTGKKAKALIAGGGIAGMKAALSLDKAGYEVVIFEKTAQLGGVMNLASKPPHKKRIGVFRDYLIKQVSKNNIGVRFNQELTVEKVRALAPDLLVVATGAKTAYPAIKGIESEIVVDGLDVLAGKAIVENMEVIIIGGGNTGTELAAYMLEKGNKITIVEKNPYLAMNMEKKNRRDLLNRLEKGSIIKKTSTQTLEITSEGLWIQDLAGQKEFLKADKVVISTGVKSQQELYDQCQEVVRDMVMIGDANRLRGFREALQEAAALGIAWRRE